MALPAPLLRGPFCFLRHGETEPNRLGLIAGSTDVPLNDTGFEQARAAARLLANVGIDAIYSSPLRRARETADIAAQALRLPVTVIPEIAERNWGELEGRPRAERVRGVTPPGAETLEAFTARTLAGLARVREGHRLPLVVAHSGTFRVLCAHLAIAAPEQPVENSRPLRFVPPAGGHSWRIVPCDDKTARDDSL
jgi:broad specificity phosphatase PhoE